MITRKRAACMAVIPCVAFIAGCSSIDQSLELQKQAIEQQRTILTELAAINERMDQLAAEGNAASDRSARVEYLTSITKSSARGNANIEALAAIPEPANDTPEAVQRYINGILAISDGQRRFGSDDTQVIMLSALGEEHLSLLLDAMSRYDSGTARYHLRYAVMELANEDTKSRIIDAFRKNPDNGELLTIINRKKWGADAKEILVTKLEQSLADTGRRHVDMNVVRLLAETNDQEIYPLLIRCLVEKDNRSYTYSVLEKLPDINLDRAVLEAWRKSAGSNERDRTFLAALALKKGDRDALEYLISRLDQASTSSSRHDPRTTVLAHIDFAGTNEEIRTWYYTNHENIYYEESRQRFVIRESLSE